MLYSAFTYIMLSFKIKCEIYKLLHCIKIQIDKISSPKK